MPKLPDFSKLTEKLDLQHLMDNVKSLVKPGSHIPPGMENDAMGAKLILLQAAIQNLMQLHEQQREEIEKINTLLAALFKDLDHLKKDSSSTGDQE